MRRVFPPISILIAFALIMGAFVACEENEVEEQIDSTAPVINLSVSEMNIFGGVEVILMGNELYLGSRVVATWKDDVSKVCEAVLSLDGKSISSGTILSEAGKLTITVTDEACNASSTSIVLTSDAIFGMEALGQLRLQVDEEVDLLSGISFPPEVKLNKVEIVIDEIRTEVPNPTHYSPEYPGTARLIFTLQLNNDSIFEVESQTIDILPLSMPGYSIAQAAIGDGWEGVSTGYRSYTVKMNFEDTGVFKAWALLREVIAHGTRDASASEIKTRLLRHQPVIFGEHPLPIDTLHWYSSNGANWKQEQMIVNFEEECRFLCPDISDKIRNDWELGADTHGRKCTGILYITTYPVLHALGMRIGIVGAQVPIDQGEDAYRNYHRLYEGHEEELNWIESHPETIFYRTSSVGWGDEYLYYPRLSIQPNMGICMSALGNVPPNGKYLITKYGEELPEHASDNEPWSYGAEGVIGGLNDGETRVNNPPTIGNTRLPVESHKNDDDLWCETSEVLGSSQATSPASPAAMGKFYLASLLNYALDPNLTVHENKRQIREACLDQYVYFGEELYMIGKRVNPGGIVEEYFSTLPSSVSLSSEELFPLPLGVFPNCVVMGPGVVNAEGTPVTDDNYLEMIGKQLYISPIMLRKYGVTPGSKLEYTEHLCLDEDGTGIDNPSEAGKSICNRVSVVSVL